MLPEITVPCAFEEIRVERSGPISFVYFDFYNGAMNKYQAARLERVLKHVGREDCRLVALMGGDRFFSTGIVDVILIFSGLYELDLEKTWGFRPL